MNDDINMHLKDGNFSVILKKNTETKIPILPAVWALRRKRKMIDGSIYKHKSRINLDGRKKNQGIHYNESCAPMAQWTTIRMILSMAQIRGWYSVHIDYVQEFTQDPNEKTMIMKIPKGYKVIHSNNGYTLKETDDQEEFKQSNDQYCLQLHRNLYGQVQAGKVWYQYLSRKLKHIGFSP